MLMLAFFSTNRLAERLRAGEGIISFDKDDDDTLDFVTAAANLRSSAYGIEEKTRWEVKGKQQSLQFSEATKRILLILEMAGNIIPAIATTNAIISGLIVLQALHLLRKSYKSMKNVHLQFKPAVPLSTINMCPPNPNCRYCAIQRGLP
jgi:ubiquitin-like 1-activating enzyme E1 B